MKRKRCDESKYKKIKEMWGEDLCVCRTEYWTVHWRVAEGLELHLHSVRKALETTCKRDRSSLYITELDSVKNRSTIGLPIGVAWRSPSSCEWIACESISIIGIVIWSEKVKWDNITWKLKKRKGERYWEEILFLKKIYEN